MSSQPPEPQRHQVPLPSLGEVVGGRFLVEGWVAQGGMAAVFRARDTLHGESVALKVSTKPHVGGNARFEREQLTLAVRPACATAPR